MGIKAIKPIQKVTLAKGQTFSYHNMIKINTNESVQKYYQFIQKIGQGSFAEVFRAKSILTSNMRAIKKISKQKHPNARSMILNEFDILKQLDHPNILKMYQIYEQQNYFYIVTQLCTGKQLFDVIIQVKKFRQAEACQIFYDICSAVKTLHEHNIMHRDLKPQNIMYSKNLKSLKLIDFGSATFFQTNTPVQRKRTGTSYYIAPEVLSRVYNQKCDIWSLGVILYILLSGDPPFKGKNDADILKAVIQNQLQFKKDIWKKISVKGIDLIKKMIQRNVNKRLSISEVLTDQWFKEHLPKKVIDKRQQNSIAKYLSNMKQFNDIQKNPIQEGILIFIINFVKNNKDQTQMMRVFKTLDLNGDGVISLHELKLGMSRYLKLGQREALYVAKKIFQKVDINNSNSIDYSEFVMSASSIELTITEENIDIAFDYIDTDRSGYLSVSQIRQKLGDNLSQDTYSKLLKQFDKNGDGEISRYQFRQMMRGLVKSKKIKK